MADSTNPIERLLLDRGDNGKRAAERNPMPLVPEVRIKWEWPWFPDEADPDSFEWVVFRLQTLVDSLESKNLTLDDPDFFSGAEYLADGEPLDVPSDRRGSLSIAAANYNHLQRELSSLVGSRTLDAVESEINPPLETVRWLVREHFESSLDAVNILRFQGDAPLAIQRLEDHRVSAAQKLMPHLVLFLASLYRVGGGDVKATLGLQIDRKHLDRLEITIDPLARTVTRRGKTIQLAAEQQWPLFVELLNGGDKGITSVAKEAFFDRIDSAKGGRNKAVNTLKSELKRIGLTLEDARRNGGHLPIVVMTTSGITKR